MSKTKINITKTTTGSKDESFTEKVGHAIGNAASAIKNKFEEIVHPSKPKTKRKPSASPATKTKISASFESSPKKRSLSATTSKPAAVEAAVKKSSGNKTGTSSATTKKTVKRK